MRAGLRCEHGFPERRLTACAGLLGGAAGSLFTGTTPQRHPMASPLRRITSLFRRPQAPQLEQKSAGSDVSLSAGTAGTPRQPALDPLKLIEKRTELSSWVYDCVRLRAQSLASVRWYGVQQTSEGEAEPLDTMHPLNQLLQYANKHWTFGDLEERAQMQLDSTGNAYITKVRARGMVRELWVMPPGAVSPIPSSTGKFIDGYELNTANGVSILKPSEVIHLQYPDPVDPYVGLSPMGAALQAIDLDIRAVEWNRNLVENRAVAETALTYPKPLSQRAYDEVLERLSAQHMGPTSAGRPWVLDGGATLQSFGATPRDMDWLASRKFNREEICSIFSVPPPLVGIFDNATYNNIETADRMFWQNGMMPVLRRWQAALNQNLAREFGPDIKVEFDVSHVASLQTASKQAVETAQKLWSMGVPLAEVNALLNIGLPHIVGDSVGYVAAGLTPSAISGGEFDDVGMGASPGADAGDAEERAAELEEELAEKHAELDALRTALDMERKRGPMAAE